MKVQSTVKPEMWEIRKVVDGQVFVKLRKNVETFTTEEGDDLFSYDEVEITLPKIQKLDEFINANFNELWNLNPVEYASNMTNERLEAVEQALMEVILNG